MSVSGGSADVSAASVQMPGAHVPPSPLRAPPPTSLAAPPPPLMFQPMGRGPAGPPSYFPVPRLGFPGAVQLLPTAAFPFAPHTPQSAHLRPPLGPMGPMQGQSMGPHNGQSMGPMQGQPMGPMGPVVSMGGPQLPYGCPPPLLSLVLGQSLYAAGPQGTGGFVGALPGHHAQLLPPHLHHLYTPQPPLFQPHNPLAGHRQSSYSPPGEAGSAQQFAFYPPTSAAALVPYTTPNLFGQGTWSTAQAPPLAPKPLASSLLITELEEDAGAGSSSVAPSGSQLNPFAAVFAPPSATPPQDPDVSTPPPLIPELAPMAPKSALNSPPPLLRELSFKSSKSASNSPPPLFPKAQSPATVDDLLRFSPSSAQGTRRPTGLWSRSPQEEAPFKLTATAPPYQPTKKGRGRGRVIGAQTETPGAPVPLAFGRDAEQPANLSASPAKPRMVLVSKKTAAKTPAKLTASRPYTGVSGSFRASSERPSKPLCILPRPGQARTDGAKVKPTRSEESDDELPWGGDEAEPSATDPTFTAGEEPVQEAPVTVAKSSGKPSEKSSGSSGRGSSSAAGRESRLSQEGSRASSALETRPLGLAEAWGSALDVGRPPSALSREGEEGRSPEAKGFSSQGLLSKSFAQPTTQPPSQANYSFGSTAEVFQELEAAERSRTAGLSAEERREAARFSRWAQPSAAALEDSGEDLPRLERGPDGALRPVPADDYDHEDPQADLHYDSHGRRRDVVPLQGHCKRLSKSPAAAKAQVAQDPEELAASMRQLKVDTFRSLGMSAAEAAAMAASSDSPAPTRRKAHKAKGPKKEPEVGPSVGPGPSGDWAEVRAGLCEALAALVSHASFPTKVEVLDAHGRVLAWATHPGMDPPSPDHIRAAVKALQRGGFFV